MSELEERRRRAEDYGLLDVADAEEIVYAVRTAVRSATRVRITSGVIEAFERAAERPVGRNSMAGIKAAFEAAGFEVQE